MNVSFKARIRTWRMVGLALTALAIPSGHAGDNDTPKKTNAIFVSILNSGNTHEGRVKSYVPPEKYSYEAHKFNGASPPTVSLLHDLGQDKNYAVLVIVTHAGRSGIVAERFDTVAQRDAKLEAYKADEDLRDIANHLAAETCKDTEGQVVERPAIGLDRQGVEKLFGGADSNRTILALAGCNSNTLLDVFGNTEKLGLANCASDAELSRALGRGFLRMGGADCIPKRPVQPAFNGFMEHSGPGNTTLAPAVTEHMPVNDSVLPLNVATMGSTDYDTRMLSANVDIMQAEGCNATIANEQWTAIQDGASCKHTFEVTPVVKGRLILRVKPDRAVSRNNERCLIGNLYMFDEEGERVEINTCQFGKSGLDGKRRFPPPPNPYRWCVWCGEQPEAPTDDSRRSRPPRDMENSMEPTTVPWGEQYAFVLFQSDPGPNTVITASGGPPELLFEQVADWYAHVILEPTLLQVGEVFEVLFESSDDLGPRALQPAQFDVVERVDQVGLFDTLGELPGGAIESVVAVPGEQITYSLFLLNSGNTFMSDVTLSPATISGPVDIPPGAVQIVVEPVDLLAPGESVAVSVVVTTGFSNPPGSYAGTIDIVAQTAIGPHVTTAAYDFELNTPAVIDVPDTIIDVQVGDVIDVPLIAFDVDGDDPAHYTLTRPAQSTLFDFGGGALSFQWQPGPRDTGHRVVALVADDGKQPAAYDLEFQVEGPVLVNAVALIEAFEPGEDVPLEIWYLNKNTVAADVAETVEVFEDDFEGALLWSDTADIGLLAPDKEHIRDVVIPAVGGMPQRLAIRVTATAEVDDTVYEDISELEVFAAGAIPTMSTWGVLVLGMSLMLAAGAVMRRRRASRVLHCRVR